MREGRERYERGGLPIRHVSRQVTPRAIARTRRNAALAVVLAACPLSAMGSTHDSFDRHPASRTAAKLVLTFASVRIK
mgnify:CR=1 FL=1